MRRRCPNCAGEQLSWTSFWVGTIPPLGNTIPAPKLVLGCDTCSETVQSVDLDDVAEYLTQTKWKMA